MNPIIIKIAKLLAVADDQAGMPEGDTAARFADRLMREHAISQADVDAHDLEPDPLMEGEIASGRSTWKALLVWALAEHCNCTALRATIRTNYRGSQTGRMRLFGHKSDIEILQYLFDICVRQIEDETKRWRKARGGARYGEGQEYRLSMVHGLERRLAEIRKAGQVESPESTALVVRRKDAAQRYQDQIVPQPGKARRVKIYIDPEGYEAGRNMRLHSGINGGAAAKTRELQ